jgi:hypothetical protein
MVGCNIYKFGDIGVEEMVNWPWIANGLRSGKAKL